jgi:hypothetical protein
MFLGPTVYQYNSLEKIKYLAKSSTSLLAPNPAITWINLSHSRYLHPLAAKFAKTLVS